MYRPQKMDAVAASSGTVGDLWSLNGEPAPAVAGSVTPFKESTPRGHVRRAAGRALFRQEARAVVCLRLHSVEMFQESEPFLSV